MACMDDEPYPLGIPPPLSPPPPSTIPPRYTQESTLNLHTLNTAKREEAPDLSGQSRGAAPTAGQGLKQRSQNLVVAKDKTA